jgi:hypothetical protein
MNFMRGNSNGNRVTKVLPERLPRRFSTFAHIRFCTLSSVSPAPDDTLNISKTVRQIIAKTIYDIYSCFVLVTFS